MQTHQIRVAGNLAMCFQAAALLAAEPPELAFWMRNSTVATGYAGLPANVNNVELVVKPLDGRAVNDKYRVFYGALSDVQYAITVTDTQTGAVRTYLNTSGTQASAADTTAF